MTEPPATAPSGIAASQRDVLLATKLHIPASRPDLVLRPRLTERLDEALARGLIVVCAPAGFGKTILLADWIRRGGRPVAWLSLDGVIATRRGSGGTPSPRWIGRAPGSPSGSRRSLAARSAVVRRAGDRADQRPGRQASDGEVLLLLNDYHLIDSQQVHASLMFLLDHLPA